MRRSLPYVYFGFNLACALFVLYAAHRVTAFMTWEQREYSDFGDFLGFIRVGGPAMLLGLVTSAGWAGWTISAASRRVGYRPMAWLGAVALVWLVAILGIRFV